MARGAPLAAATWPLVPGWAGREIMNMGGLSAFSLCISLKTTNYKLRLFRGSFHYNEGARQSHDNDAASSVVFKSPNSAFALIP